MNPRRPVVRPRPVPRMRIPKRLASQQTCTLCGGSGKCGYCEGKGWWEDPRGVTTCGNCWGTGKCQKCNGLGYL